MPDRLSSLDSGYQTGELSVFPLGIDDRSSLYEARNNAVTTLKQSLTFSGKLIIVEDASKFPPKGLLRIGPPPGQAGVAEFIYYANRNDSTFSELVRGFAGSRQCQWQANANVMNAVISEYHNATKDAIIQMQKDLGVNGEGRDDDDNLVLPDAASLNGILQTLETRFLAPKPNFRAFPLKGSPPLKIRFQNFSGGDLARYLWDFGDGTTSTDLSPIHTYTREGVYTVKLSVITGLGAQGIVIKKNYIAVSEKSSVPFFYVDRGVGNSIDTAGSSATVFEFVDQTDGPILERIWNFGDGERITVDDSDDHTAIHVYQSPGTYRPTLLVIFEDQSLKRIDLLEPLMVN